MNITLMVRKHVDNCKERQPIFVKDVKVSVEYKNARNIAFYKLEKENKIRRFKKGIYYKPQITTFGELGVDIEQLIIREYIQENDNIYGYVTGPVLWNSWNITTQVPNRTWIATNCISRATENEKLRVKLIKPKVEVNNANYKFLQFLDTIEQANIIQDTNWNNYHEILLGKVKKLSIEEIDYIINLTKYYNKFVENFINNLLGERGLFMNSDRYKPLNLDVLKNKKSTIITSKEALKDVTPIDWNNEIISGKKLNPRPIEVKPLADYKLEIKFNNNEVRIYDVKPLLNVHVLKNLRDVDLFNAVHLTEDNMTIEWNKNISLCADELYENSFLP